MPHFYWLWVSKGSVLVINVDVERGGRKTEMYTAYVAFVKDLKRNKSDVVKTTGLFFYLMSGLSILHWLANTI